MKLKKIIWVLVLFLITTANIFAKNHFRDVVKIKHFSAFNLTANSNIKVTDTTKVFIQISEESDVEPEFWKLKKELKETGKFIVVKDIIDANLVFEFKFKRAMGESRVSVTVKSSDNITLIWQSKKFRGTTNVFNGMSPTLHGLRKCIDKGIIPEMEKRGLIK